MDELGGGINGCVTYALSRKYADKKISELPHFNHAAQEYLNLDKFWNSLRTGKKIYS